MKRFRLSNDSRARVVALSEALSRLPHVSEAKILPASEANAHDALIGLKVSGRSLTLRLDVRSEVFPQQARHLIAQDSGRQHLVVVADLISPGARELLIQSGIGSFSTDGQLHLPFEQLYVVVDRMPQSKRPAAGRARFDLFSVARTPVLHALLLAPDRWCSVQELAIASGVSAASVSKLLTYLESDEWVDTHGTGPSKVRKLAKAAALLDAWVEQDRARLASRQMRRFFVPGRKGDDLLRFAAEAFSDRAEPDDAYAITGEAAAQIYAPFLTPWSVATLRATPAAVERAARRPDMRGVEQGANLLVIEVEPSGLRFAQRRDEVLFASPVQTYIDLMVAPGRAPDAGRFLREQVLGF